MFGIEGKAGQYIELAIGTLLIVVVGLLLIKLILKVIKKALTKTTLDGAMYKFDVDVVKAAAWSHPYCGIIRISESAYCTAGDRPRRWRSGCGSRFKRQPGQHCRGNNNFS